MMMNDSFSIECTQCEIREALEGNGDLKDPGLDGMHVLFFFKFQDMVGGKV